MTTCLRLFSKLKYYLASSVKTRVLWLIEINVTIAVLKTLSFTFSLGFHNYNINSFWHGTKV